MPKKTTRLLSEEERLQIRNDMDLQTEMLSDAEVEHLAKLMDAKIEIPFMPKGHEQTILCKIVRKVDRYLYEVLPNELYSMVKSSHEGLSVDEAQQLHEIIATRANPRFSIRYLPESVEQQVFHFLIGLLLRAMRKGMSITKLKGT
jgi:hypothetical protein